MFATRGEKPVVHRRGLGRLRLHLDDLDAIYALLSERTAGVSLTTADGVAATPRDLRGDARGEVNYLCIATRNPEIVLTLASTDAFVHTTDQATEAKVLIDDLRELLQPCRRGNHLLFTYLRQATMVTAAVLGAGLVIGAVLSSLLFGSAATSDFVGSGARSVLAVLPLGPLVGLLIFLTQRNVATIVVQRAAVGRRHKWIR